MPIALKLRENLCPWAPKVSLTSSSWVAERKHDGGDIESALSPGLFHFAHCR